jgi:hypothetical protein
LVLFSEDLGAFEYLFQQIKLHMPPKYQSKVVSQRDTESAIVKGAVTAGITDQFVAHWTANRHYLIPTLRQFREGYDPETYRVRNANGQDMSNYTRTIFIKKGQKVGIGEAIKLSFVRDIPPHGSFEQILYACDSDICPEYITDPRE